MDTNDKALQVERRVDSLHQRLPQLVEEAVNKALQSQSLLTEDERHWVRLAIQREAQSIALRQAIIEKTLAGLIWAGLAALGLALLEWAKNHGYKP